jgi:hypothetical protein
MKATEKWAKEIALMSDAEFEQNCKHIETLLNRRKQALGVHDVISCVCPNEIKTGTVSIHCCNLCGKPDEDWWGKH